jgi:CheY-like chemotaxis protein
MILNAPQSQYEVIILIAEDDDGHAELVHEHLREAGISNQIIRFINGLEVWNFLSQTGPGPYREARRAYLLLLDIRMPKMDGVEVLKRIKADPTLHSIPVIMLTTTNDPREIRDCYELGCNCYITKPVQYPRFAEAINRLGLFITIMQVTTVNGQD